MKKKHLRVLRAVLYLIILIFLGLSTFFLMGDESQIPIQMCFGFGYIVYILIAVDKRIKSLSTTKIPKIKLGRMKRDFNFSFKWFSWVFGVFSVLVFILASQGIKNNIISSIWLLGIIFVFQGACFLYLVNYMDKHKPERLRKIFNWLYVILSILFAWISAQAALNILELPVREDLFFATYGLLILPILFIIYFDYVFGYKSKDLDMIKDLKHLSHQKK